MHIKTFKYRLYPTPSQERLLRQVLDMCRHWYNMCLVDRKLAWELEKRHVGKGEQEKTGIRYRTAFPKAQAVFSQTIQVVCDDVDKAFEAFFRRVKAKETPGYPRFKGYHHFDSFGFKQYGSGDTSKCCSTCGNEFSDFSLSVRWVECSHCGLSLDRDHNAAINILKRAQIGWVTSVGHNVDAPGHACPRSPRL